MDYLSAVEQAHANSYKEEQAPKFVAIKDLKKGDVIKVRGFDAVVLYSSAMKPFTTGRNGGKLPTNEKLVGLHKLTWHSPETPNSPVTERAYFDPSHKFELVA